MRRHAEMLTVSDYVERKRRAVAGGDEYLDTLFSSHSAQNGTNMHGLQLGKSIFSITKYTIIFNYISHRF